MAAEPDDNQPVPWGAFRYEIRLLRQQAALALAGVLVGNEALEAVTVPDQLAFPAFGLIILKLVSALRP